MSQISKQLTDGEIITAFEAAGVEFMTVYNLNENANVCLTAGSQKASKIITAARSLLSQQVEAAQWVSVKDRLPENDGAVLAYDAWDGSDGEVSAFLFVGGKFYNDDPEGWKAQGLMPCDEGEVPISIGTITHWMPLPAAPDSALSSPAQAEQKGNVNE